MEDILKKRVANEVRPEQINNKIINVDNAYSELLISNEQSHKTDFG